MFNAHSNHMYTARAEQDRRVPLHNVENAGEPPLQLEGESPSSSDSVNRVDGTWGERDIGGPVNLRHAMLDYEEMRRELTTLSKTRSAGTKSLGQQSSGLKETTTRRSQRAPTRESQADVETQEGEKPEGEDSNDNKGRAEEEEDFELGEFLKDGHFEKRQEGRSAKKVGLVYKNLNVQGVGATTTFVKTLPSAIVGTFGPDLYKLLSRFIPILPQVGASGVKRDLIHDFTGVVRDGEMLLVLGRPGSGCSTFLRAVANKREGFAAVEGDVSYGGIPAHEQNKKYKGEVNYNEEDDQHFPSLTVEQTLKFSLLNKTKKHEKGDIPVIIGALLKMFGISHTRHTLVGDAYTRGVSGGERKRVSIAETLATKSTVVAWDNSTRGLDASTALDYANSLRVMTDISNRTTLVTLYQAGEGIYDLMDKVLVIDEGKMVYQGPAKAAKSYFENLGYYCPERQTTADFLTSCTDPTERRFQDDFNGPIPKGPLELEKAFRESASYKNVLKDVDEYEKMLHETNHADAREFKQSVAETKSKHVSDKSSYTVSFFRQILACTKREFWLTWGDKTTLYTKFFIIISNGLIVGSLFYGQSTDTAGAFSRGGTIFFSILFLGWLQLSELMKAVSGRTIIARHNDYAFYRPSAVVIARVLQDLPLILVQVIPFSIIMYFLTGLDVDVSKFFIYFLFIYITTICITALYRMFAALSPAIDDAVRFSGIALNLLIIYTGYVIPRPQLLQKYIWFGWLYWVNPIAYSFEAVSTDEFYDRVLECAPITIVPRGPGYGNPAYQGCAFTGAQVGSLNVPGADYLSTSFNYSRSNLWRNFGVVIAFTFLYILVTMIASELFNFSSSGGGALEFKRSKAAKQKVKAASAPTDVEKVTDSSANVPTSSTETLGGNKADEALQELSSSSIFTWENVEYTVPYMGGERKLLNKVNGYAKPGVMVALMGASGAGKTTLLNTLSQRQKTGVIGGDMLVDGRPLGMEFQRGTGFCEQMDLHDGTATIREAVEFSAILRQDRGIPRAEKIAYVDKIIEMLELGDVQDALVRCLGVEQRKRVTIGVELAAKPNLLLFLDEPTSGLDSQSAYSIVRFLKKLSNAGQAIVCTIHQPSSVLIQQFDMILALNPGGNTFYFGPVGDEGRDVIKYFADRGVQCPPQKNVAEFILETAAKGGKREDGRKLDWNKEWLNSKQARRVLDEIKKIKSERSQVQPTAQAEQHEFASPVPSQTIELTKRLFIQYWRDPSYLYGKLFTSVVIGIFNGFTFFKLGNSIQDMQNRMFTSFLILLIPPTIVNAVVPKFYTNMGLWQAREHPSRIYGWVAFCTANVVAEIPIAIVGATIYWVLWYWPTGLPTDSSTSGYVFLMTMLFFLFQASWGQWICAFAPSFTVIANVLPFFFVMFSLFNGVVRPYAQLSVFWRYWLYWLNPSTYWIGGVLAATLSKAEVQCTPQEAAYFNPPPGQSCSQYASAFVSTATGYLTNPDATTNCGYCQFKSGVEYMATLNIEPKDKWRYFGIFLAFCISNWALVYFFIYTVRIKGWSFGLGRLFGYGGKLVGAMKKPFKRGSKDEKSKA
ncbi:probable ATP-binding multidrug cassette transport protein [Rhynchosporium graminicola]|uniref:ABC multidrug transporter atrF n=1 Tax=Rhynchosporium graminicola TaxID=2792576 RepID=A0A1E1JXY7_9HELO|nr:probable ATP-binding multidrug cassette transport protein [Rhynchosporium commune]